MMSALLLLGMQLGPIERLPRGIEQCQRYIDAQPALRMARINGHLALTVADQQFGWVVDKQDAKRWCRYGVNRIRLDLWPDTTKEGGSQ